MSSTSTPKSALLARNTTKSAELKFSNLEYTNPVPITPMPNFDDLDTPEIQRQAQRYGLKRTMAKTKLKTKLEEVYLYTHQTYSPSNHGSNKHSDCNLESEKSVTKSTVSDATVNGNTIGSCALQETPIKSCSTNVSRTIIINHPSPEFYHCNGDVIEIDGETNRSCDDTVCLVETSPCPRSPKGHLFVENDIADNSATSAMDMSGIIRMELETEYSACDPGGLIASPLPASGSVAPTKTECVDAPVISLLDSSDGEAETSIGNDVKLADIRKKDNVNVPSITVLDSSPWRTKKTTDETKLNEQLTSDKQISANCIDLTALESSYGDDISHSVSDIFADLTPVRLEAAATSVVKQKDGSSPQEENTGVESVFFREDGQPSISSFDNIKNGNCYDGNDASTEMNFQSGSDTDPLCGGNSEEEYSERERFHQSLFGSLHHNSTSDSSSAEQSEEECVSLFQRISRKRKVEDMAPEIDTKFNIVSTIQESQSLCEELSNEGTSIDIQLTTKGEKSDYDKLESQVSRAKPLSVAKKSRKLLNKDSIKSTHEKLESVNANKAKKPKLTKEELELEMCNAIRTNEQLHTDILLYKPIYFSKFKTLMKNYGLQVSADDLRDFLDSKGITFSTADENRQKGPRVPKRRPKAKS